MKSSQLKPLVPAAQALNRRRIIKAAGGVLGAGAALAGLSGPARAADPNSIAGLWAAVVSPAGSASFQAFENWGADGTWTGRGQNDLTPYALKSTASGQWQQTGTRTYRLIARFWTYSLSAIPTGYAAIDFTYTLGANGTTYLGAGLISFYDTENQFLSSAETSENGVRIA